MNESVKGIYIYLVRNLRKVFSFLPIKKNRIIFESFSGEGYSCNPKYIYLKLNEKYPKRYECVWALRDTSQAPKNAVVCHYRSWRHFIYRMTSKIYVCNFLQADEIPKRKGQIEIQTWHGGGCYKNIGNDEKGRSKVYTWRRNLQLSETDYFIVSSNYWKKKVLEDQLNYHGTALEIGMPRNDMFINGYSQENASQLREKIGIPQDVYFVLYAPTWRDISKKYTPLDFEMVKSAFERQTGKKCIMAFRAHIYGENQNAEHILDLTEYPDMQELLYCADALVTDYSSSMWDYSFTYKPCFLYVPDLERYTVEHGFDRDIYSWGFPVCPTNNDLVRKIEEFDHGKYVQQMHKHHDDLESFESGCAGEKVAQLINNICTN